MVTDKIEINRLLVGKLISNQFPKWADLLIKPVASSGWDNRTFHLGENMTIRLPSNAEYAPQVEKEQYWLSVTLIYHFYSTTHKYGETY